MSGPPVFAEHRTFRATDGELLAYQELGEGRPLILLHGFTSTGAMWLDPGPAAALAGAGHRVIVPDLRGHGSSAAPDDPGAYPPDVLTDDVLALVEHLGCSDHDLVGYSLGGRIALRLLVRGARPGHVVVGGQGLQAVTGGLDRSGTFRRALDALVAGRALDPGSPESDLAGWIRSSGNDPRALRRVLDAQLPVDVDDLAEVAVPVLVLVGHRDTPHAPSAAALAEAFPRGRHEVLDGDHVSALADPSLAARLGRFLSEREDGSR